MAGLKIRPDPALLVGTATSDDAAVYRIAGDLALVLTLDYVTPMVDDPCLYGEIAAANALSDVYAMGGRPVAAMNICSFPKKGDPASYRKVIEGGLAKVQEAGASLVGGQTVEGEELVYGLSVTGVVHPDRIWRNAGARAGDILILTKPVGTGVIVNAVKLKKGGGLGEPALARVAEFMKRLNKGACEAALRFEVHAATDITGFGLAGHAAHIARESGVALRFEWGALPHYEESLELIRRGVSTGLTKQNRSHLEGRIAFDDRLPGEARDLFFDPQTSGGLLLAVAPADAEGCLAAIRESGAPESAAVGRVEAGAPRIIVDC